jgi:hypothetical protein
LIALFSICERPSYLSFSSRYRNRGAILQTFRRDNVYSSKFQWNSTSYESMETRATLNVRSPILIPTNIDDGPRFFNSFCDNYQQWRNVCHIFDVSLLPHSPLQYAFLFSCIFLCAKNGILSSLTFSIWVFGMCYGSSVDGFAFVVGSTEPFRSLYLGIQSE